MKTGELLTMPTSTQLLEAASGVMADQGISAMNLDPAVVVIAAVKPKTVFTIGRRDFGNRLDAGHQVFLAELDAQYPHRLENDGYEAPSVPTPEELEAINKADKDHVAIENMGWKLNKWARRRTLASAFAAGYIAGNGIMLATGAMSPGDADGVQLVPEDAEHQVIEGNTSVWDSSIMPGDTGANIPVIGPILRNIPGYIDDGRERRTYVFQTPVTETVPKVTIEQKVDLSTALNPLAPDLELTGSEYTLDRAAASDLLTQVTGVEGTFTPDHVKVTGTVSDDFNGQVGQSNPEQLKLANARALVAAQALRDEAIQKGIALPTEIEAVGQETVLDGASGLLTEFTQLVTNEKLTTEQALARYDGGLPLSQPLRDFMDKNIGANRGAVMEVTGTLTKTVEKEVTRYEDEEYPDSMINGEVIGGLWTFIGFIYGGVFPMLRRRGRNQQRVARRQVKKAGLDLTNINLLELAAVTE